MGFKFLKTANFNILLLETGDGDSAMSVALILKKNPGIYTEYIRTLFK